MVSAPRRKIIKTHYRVVNVVKDNLMVTLHYRVTIQLVQNLPLTLI